MFTCVHYCDSVVLSEAVRCVEVSTELLSTCRRGLGISTSVQQFLLPSLCVHVHVHTYPFIMHWLRLFVVVFQEMECLLHFHYEVSRQGLEIVSSFVFHSVFLCQLHAHTYAIKNVRLFFVEIHNFNHDDVHHITELYLSTSFVSVSAVVSEIHDLNQNKRRKHQFTTFPRHITDPFLPRACTGVE